MYFSVAFYMKSALAYAKAFDLSNAETIIEGGMKHIEDLQNQIGINRHKFVWIK